jgi:hypothetical protein
MLCLRSVYLAFFLILMARFVCPGNRCGREFPSNASLSAHKRSCKLKLAATAKLLLRTRRGQHDRHSEVSEQVEVDADLEGELIGIMPPEPEVSISLNVLVITSFS